METEEEALAFIEEMRKKYWDARHNCFAYVIGEKGELQRCSDDGEPSQTAGRPMLDVLLGEEVRNVCAVVTRYFGGTLLGTGGLVRAYSGAVQEGLKNSVIVTKRLADRLEVQTDYNSVGKIQYIAARQGSRPWTASIPIPSDSPSWSRRTIRSSSAPRSPKEPAERAGWKKTARCTTGY